MKRWMALAGVVALSLFGVGCDEDDIDAFSETMKDVGDKAAGAIEDTTKSLGDNIEAGKQNMRDAAKDIEER